MESFNDNLEENNLNENAIDLREIFYYLIKGKKLISLISFLGLILGLIYSLNLKNIWQGEMQIVLNTESQKDLDLGLASFFSSSSSSNALKTEVEILQSPFALADIFLFIKEQKKWDENKRFNSWKKNLRVNLINETSVLELSYRDTDKELIIPVLTKISNTYQKYSTSKKNREIELGLNFYESQINAYKEKSKSSLNNAQNYAKKYNLGLIDRVERVESDKDYSSEDFLTKNINVEVIRTQAAKQLDSASQSLKFFEDENIDLDQIIYFSNINPEFSLGKFIEQINDIDRRLSFLKNSFKSNDRSIVQMKKERTEILKTSKKRIINGLQAKIKESELLLRSSSRPEGVVENYKQLLQELRKDEITLNELDNKFRSLEIEQARFQDPWKLITKPTLLPNPVAPNRALNI